MTFPHNKPITKRWLVFAVMITSLLSIEATAQNPKGGGAGGGGATSVSFNIVALDSASSFASDISQKTAGGTRLVAGSVGSSTSNNYQAACWVLTGSGSQTQNSRFLLTDYGGSQASGVSVNGAIVGQGLQQNGQSVGFYWSDVESLPIELPGLPEESFSFAVKLNSAGMVIGGSSRDGDGQTETHALAWRVSEGPATLPIILPSLFLASGATANNDLVNAISEVNVDGQALAVGMSNGVPVAWVLSLVANGELSVDATPLVLDTEGEARGINRNGAVCGHDVWNAVIWDGATKKILSWDANTFLQRGIPTGINATQFVVGYGRETKTSREQAVFWSSPTSTMQSLDRFLPKSNSPFTYLKYASAINNDREIVGYGWHSGSGTTRAFLATPK